MRIVHFADAHIDIANYGRHDSQSGLPLRVLDFLKSLDVIVETAIAERVDLVLFAGDAYKDRTPAPTFQREWGKRILRLSKAGIPTLLLLGNHDVSPAIGRAHAVQEFDTLEVPGVRVLDKPQFLRPDDLGLPLQVLALPWVSRSGLIAALDLNTVDSARVLPNLEDRLTNLVHGWLEQADPTLPTILLAHALVEGARYGSERMVMLGAEWMLSGSLVRDPRLDYVALGHVHRAQNLNENAHPPVVYAGSIERVDFGEAEEKKFFVIADVKRGQTRLDWRELTHIRPFVDRRVALTSPENVTAALKAALPAPESLEGAIVRLTVEYPREWETLIDEVALRAHLGDVFEFHLVRRPQIEGRIRLPAEQTAAALSPLELLDQYWRASKVEESEIAALQALARRIILGDEEGT